jgi:hypothetical protein
LTEGLNDKGALFTAKSRVFTPATKPPLIVKYAKYQLLEAQ